MFKKSSKKSHPDNRLKRIVSIPKKDYFEDMMKTVEFRPSEIPQPLKRMKLENPISISIMDGNVVKRSSTLKSKDMISSKRSQKKIIRLTQSSQHDQNKSPETAM